MIALDPLTAAELKAHRDRQLQERDVLGEGYEDHDLVFCCEDGKPFGPERLTAAFRTRVRKGKLPTLTFHGLRHTYGSLALAEGIHPKVVQERLGHSSISITLDLYSHSIPALQETAAATVTASIFAVDGDDG